MTIPEARERLLAIAAQIDPALAAEVQRIVKEGMYRRRGVTPTAPKSQRMTKGLAVKIRAMHYNDPSLSGMELAVANGVNTGRVSEAITGKRV
jgi:hypothetical protein